MDFPVLDIQYKWQHTICGLYVWFLYFSNVFSRFTHVVSYQYLTLFYEWVIFLYIDTAYIIYPFILLGSFHIWLLWITLLWTFYTSFLCKYMFIYLGFIFEYEIAKSHGYFVVNLWGIAKLLFKVATVIYIPTISFSGPTSPYPPQHLLFSISDYSYSSRYKISHFGFYFNLPSD